MTDQQPEQPERRPPQTVGEFRQQSGAVPANFLAAMQTASEDRPPEQPTRRYRKRPVVIEAFRYLIDPQPDWFCDRVSRCDITTYKTYCNIQTLEGTRWANRGDWIIKGIKNEVHRCRPDIFTATYEAVSEQPTRPAFDAEAQGGGSPQRERSNVSRVVSGDAGAGSPADTRQASASPPFDADAAKRQAIRPWEWPHEQMLARLLQAALDEIARLSEPTEPKGGES